MQHPGSVRAPIVRPIHFMPGDSFPSVMPGSQFCDISHYHPSLTDCSRSLMLLILGEVPAFSSLFSRLAQLNTIQYDNRFCTLENRIKENTSSVRTEFKRAARVEQSPTFKHQIMTEGYGFMIVVKPAQSPHIQRTKLGQ